MAPIQRSPKQPEKSYQYISIGLFGIEVYNSGNISLNFFIDLVKAIEMEGDNAGTLAMLVHQLLGTDFGSKISKYITDQLDVCQHPKAGEFKYQFMLKLNELIQRNNTAVPATRVLSND